MLLIAVLPTPTSIRGLQVRGHFYRGPKGTLSKWRDSGNLASGNFKAIASDAKSFWGTMTGYGASMTESVANIFKNPDYSPAVTQAVQRFGSSAPGKHTDAGRHQDGAAGTQMAVGLTQADAVPLQITSPITIHAAPGMDEKKIALLCRREIERVVREAEARRRAALHD